MLSNAVAKPAGEVAILEKGQAYLAQWQQGSALAAWQPVGTKQVVLGSVWKLFVYAYLLDQQIASADYHCDGRTKEEVYCCTAGQSIDREAALVRSCGLFFAPSRLGIQEKAWKNYWQNRGAPPWIWSLQHLNERQTVLLADLLATLMSLPPRTRQSVASALVGVVSLGTGRSGFSRLGSQLRVKTWTMPNPVDKQKRVGGGLGWLADGTPIWLMADGTSDEALTKLSEPLLPLLAAHPAAQDIDCVTVRYFARYPVSKVENADTGIKARSERLNGRWRVKFENGNRVVFHSTNEMQFIEGRTPQLLGRFSINEYVARVLDREADPTKTEAAKALAIVARSYLLQNASYKNGCYWIDDSTRFQRVSPNAATLAAKRIANWSDELILVGASVRFHESLDASGVLSWQAALKETGKGAMARDVLLKQWPMAVLQSYRAPVQSGCERMPLAEHWLSKQTVKWQRRLRAEDGFEPPSEAPLVCRTLVGNPNSESDELKIYIKSFVSEEDRIALIHEYLHLAFAHHPHGVDEVYIEQQARRLQRDTGNEHD